MKHLPPELRVPIERDNPAVVRYAQCINCGNCKFTCMDHAGVLGHYDLSKTGDNAICIYKMKSGIIGTMTASWTYYGEEDNSTIIYGTEGMLKIYHDPKYCIELIRKDGGKVFYDIDQIQTNDNQIKSGIIDAFVESVENDTEPAVPGKSVLSAMKAIFGSLKSSELGRTVRVERRN